MNVAWQPLGHECPSYGNRRSRVNRCELTLVRRMSPVRVSDMNVQGTGIADQSLDSFLGVGVALDSVFPVSVFAESDDAAVEVSLAFFAASAPFLYDSLR